MAANPVDNDEYHKYQKRQRTAGRPGRDNTRVKKGTETAARDPQGPGFIPMPTDESYKRGWKSWCAEKVNLRRGEPDFFAPRLQGLPGA